MIPKIIVITGVDGSGKTTQATLLFKSLKQQGLSVGFVQQFSPNRITKIILKRAGSRLKKAERSVSKQSYFNKNNSKSSIFKSFLRFSAITFTLYSGWIRTWSKFLLHMSSEVIISDRYFYDDLIKANWLYGANINNNLLFNLVPKPSIIFYLDIPAELAWTREMDGDTTLEQHIKKKEFYGNWLRSMDSCKIYKVNTEKDIYETNKEMQEFTTKYLIDRRGY
jgi:thymidylate kinase